MLLNLGLMRCGSRAKTFGQIRNAIPTTIEMPAVYTSRRCYFTAATGTAYTVPADTEVRFNDSGAWLSTIGATPAGAKFWRCRFESSTDYETIMTKTPTLGSGLNLVSSLTAYGTAGFEYETFLSSGKTITSAINTAGSGYALTSAFGLVVGKSYQIRIDLTLNSGAPPYIIIGTSAAAAGSDFPGVQLSTGINTFVFNHDTALDDHLWIFNLAEASNYSAIINVAEMVDYPFVITTMADLSFGPTWEDSETWDDTKTWNE